MPVQKRGKNSWLITINNGSDEHGNRIRITRTVHAENKTEAMRYEKILAGEVAKKYRINPHKMTLHNFYEYWTTNYLYAQNRSDKTIQSYNELFRRIDAALGHKAIDKILPRHILSFLQQLQDCCRLDKRQGKLSANSIRKHYVLLNLVFKKAVQWHFIINNPVENIDAPKYKYNNHKKILNREELGKFLIALNDENIKYRLWAMLCLSLGLRRGEVIGLQWKHIDFKQKTVTIEQSVQYIVHKGLKIKPPKTESSNRILELSDTLIELLYSYKHIKQQEQHRLCNKWIGAKDIKENFIFTNFYGGVAHPDSMNIWLKKFTKKHNLPAISPHSLRHMTATYLINAGVDLVTVAGVMGHINSTTTQTVYAHFLQKTQNKTVKIMDKILIDSIKETTK